MNQKISNHEWEALSAYLDGQLSSKERARLEEKLRVNLALSKKLEELQKTRQLLRSQPRIKPPRNFTLTRELVGSRPEILPGWFRITPALQFTSAIASVLLVLVFITDLLALGPANMERPIALDNASRVMEVSEPIIEIESEEMPVEEAMELPLAMMEKSISGTSGPDEIVEGESVQGQAPLVEETYPASPVMAVPVEEKMESDTDRSLGGLPSQVQAELDATQSTETIPTDSDVLLQQEIQGSAEDLSSIESFLAVDKAWWRVSEISLLLIALVSGLLAVYLRRAANS